MKQIMRPSLAAVAVIAALGVAGISQAQTSTAATTVDKAKASEIVGYKLAEGYPEWARSLIDPRAVGQAVTRALEGQKFPLSDAEAENVMKPFSAQLQALGKQHYEQVAVQNKQAGDAYLAKNKSQPGVRVTSDGLQYQVITQGTGPKPKATDTVQLNYTGSFVNGMEFDSSAKHGTGPAKLDLNNVFPGFKEAVMMMPVGSHYKFVIPSDLAYGAEPKNGFPPNETLIFDVTLVKIGAE
ncbi:MAG: FKBP-type peptidyl-prolyl cis-trans isomerase FklB [Rhodanobacteraceae bacterium]|nr:MAG: FKBP-type peptidyl-prolyl cis-trans isomerase FklB [Rhodanobacteraceae bacterium]